MGTMVHKTTYISSVILSQSHQFRINISLTWLEKLSDNNNYLALLLHYYTLIKIIAQSQSNMYTQGTKIYRCHFLVFYVNMILTNQVMVRNQDKK